MARGVLKGTAVAASQRIPTAIVATQYRMLHHKEENRVICAGCVAGYAPSFFTYPESGRCEPAGKSYGTELIDRSPHTR